MVQKKAAAHVREGKGAKAGILRSMMLTEEVCQQHRQKKYTSDKLDGGGVEMVTMALLDGSIRVAQDKYELEKVITKENESKYMLACDSPPLQAPLVDVLKSSGLIQATTDIVEGNFPPPINTDERQKSGLNKWKKPPRRSRPTSLRKQLRKRSTRKGGKRQIRTQVVIYWVQIIMFINVQHTMTP